MAEAKQSKVPFITWPEWTSGSLAVPLLLAALLRFAWRGQLHLASSLGAALPLCFPSAILASLIRASCYICCLPNVAGKIKTKWDTYRKKPSIFNVAYTPSDPVALSYSDLIHGKIEIAQFERHMLHNIFKSEQLRFPADRPVSKVQLRAGIASDITLIQAANNVLNGLQPKEEKAGTGK